MLMEYQAVEIYRRKISSYASARSYEDKSSLNVCLLRRESESLSKRYKITIRAIQDIWNRRSWAYATNHLWAQEQGDSDRMKYYAISAAEVRHRKRSCTHAHANNGTIALTTIVCSQTLMLKRPGRPKGAKDRQPRAKANIRPAEAASCRPLLPAKCDPAQTVSSLLMADIRVPESSTWLDNAFEPWTGNISVLQVDPFHNDWPHW